MSIYATLRKRQLACPISDEDFQEFLKACYSSESIDDGYAGLLFPEMFKFSDKQIAALVDWVYHSERGIDNRLMMFKKICEKTLYSDTAVPQKIYKAYINETCKYASLVSEFVKHCLQMKSRDVMESLLTSLFPRYTNIEYAESIYAKLDSELIDLLGLSDKEISILLQFIAEDRLTEQRYSIRIKDYDGAIFYNKYLKKLDEIIFPNKSALWSLYKLPDKYFPEEE